MPLIPGIPPVSAKKPDEKTSLRSEATGRGPGGQCITLVWTVSLLRDLNRIAKIDTSTGAPSLDCRSRRRRDGGCDGLYWHEGDLIVIQNVTNPGRICRIETRR